MSLVRHILFLTLLISFSLAVPVSTIPKISEIGFSKWFELSTQADREAEVPHEPSTLSKKPRVTRQGEPYQGHIVVGDHITEMRVMWVATGPVLQGAVKFGSISGKLTNIVFGTAKTYGPEEMCGAEDHMNGYSYSVLLKGLAPSSRYYYRFGSFDNEEWSKEFSFQTPPAPGSLEAKSVEFVAYGDMGYFDSGKRVAELIEEKELDDAEFIVHVGDLSYADGSDEFWDDFMDQIEPIAATVPYFVNIGNHEVEDGECGVPYNTRFTMPTNGLPDANLTRNLWYSFNWGPIHFLQMSTENDFSKGSPQWNYLVSDLKKVNRTQTPWIIFTGHRMMYSKDDGSFGEGMRDELEDVLFENKVDLAWWGHAHQYERTCAVYKEKCVKEFNGDNEISNPGAPIHIVMGMAGRSYQYSDKKREEVAEWEDFYAKDLGYTKILADHQHLLFKFRREKDGKTYDSFTIFKS